MENTQIILLNTRKSCRLHRKRIYLEEIAPRLLMVTPPVNVDTAGQPL